MRSLESLAGKALWFAVVAFLMWKPITATYRAIVPKAESRIVPGLVVPPSYLGRGCLPEHEYNGGLDAPFARPERAGSLAAEVLNDAVRE